MNLKPSFIYQIKKKPSLSFCNLIFKKDEFLPQNLCKPHNKYPLYWNSDPAPGIKNIHVAQNSTYLFLLIFVKLRLIKHPSQYKEDIWASTSVF
jgi:hypothetical protein